MAKISISYIHPTLGPTQIKGVQQVYTVGGKNGAAVIGYQSAEGEYVRLITNVPFVVREVVENEPVPAED